MAEQRKSIEYTKRGRRVLALLGVMGVSAVATPFVASAVSGGEKPKPAPATPSLTLYEEMDAAIAREIPKGPEAEDNRIAERAIQMGESITGIMIDVDPSTDYRDEDTSVLQRKATIASNDTPEPYRGEDETFSENAVIWEDAALNRQFGQRVVLAIPVNQIRQP